MRQVHLKYIFQILIHLSVRVKYEQETALLNNVLNI